MSVESAIAQELRLRLGALSQTSEPLAGILEEVLADLVVESVGLATAGRLLPQHAGLVSVLLRDLAARLGVTEWSAGLAAAADFLAPALEKRYFAALLADARTLVTAAATGQGVAVAAQSVLADCDRLAAVYEQEWRPGVTTADQTCSAGGEEFVLRAGRLVVAAALVASAQAIAATDAEQVAETTARRYAWRWLRAPVPEAAHPRHRLRTLGILAGFGAAGA